MLEKKVEYYFYKQVKTVGGRAYKLTSPGRPGMPDRLCVFPGGHVRFVELKSPDGVLRDEQTRRIKEIRDMGGTVDVIRSKKEVDVWIKSLNLDLIKT